MKVKPVSFFILSFIAAQAVMAMEPMIAFTLIGKAGTYVMNLNSGKRRFISAGKHPRFFPDGRRIGLVNFGRIELVDITSNQIGNPKPIDLPHEAWSFDFSPDGKEIVYSGKTGGENEDLFIFSFKDGSVRKITDTPDINEEFPRFSPDGEKVLFWAYTLRRMDFYIGIVDIDTGRGWRIETDREKHGWEFEPDWSPDGRRVVFSSRSGEGYNLFLYDLDNGHEKQLTKLRCYARGPVFSPDGGKIAFRCAVKEFGNKTDIFILDLGRKKLANITNTPDESESVEDWFDPRFAYPVDLIRKLFTMWGMIKR
ncbi:PD40 domain-containing protein [Candidatus Poribacteria bacterium]|nr:PD40 domain-containing protein [Candidatus Poribacteria bacterium]